MDAIADLSWRAFPSSIIMAAGLALFVYGVETIVRAHRVSVWDMKRPIVWVGGLRAAIIALAVVALGAAWLSQQLWVLLIALVIGCEELLETSVILFVLRRSRRVERMDAPAE